MNPRIQEDFTYKSAARNRCYLTDRDKRPEDAGVINTGVWIDGEGSLDISFQAIEELASIIGWQSPAQVEADTAALRAEVEYQKAVAADAVAQFQLAEARIKALTTKAAVEATTAAKPRGRR